MYRRCKRVKICRRAFNVVTKNYVGLLNIKGDFSDNFLFLEVYGEFSCLLVPINLYMRKKLGSNDFD